MKIIVRNRKKQIQVGNITSKEEMIWINPELYAEITSEAGAMAAEFMKKFPQIHEVKFSVLPQMDAEESEEDFYAGEEEAQSRRVIIINEDKLEENLAMYASQYPDDHWTMDQVKERLNKTDDINEGMEFGDSVSTQEPDTCHHYKAVCISPDVVVYEYLGISKC